MHEHAAPSRRKVITGTFAAAAVATLSGTAASAQGATLRITTAPSDLAALPFYAQDNGDFARAGLDVEITIANNGGASLAALAGNAIELSDATAGSIAASVSRGLDFVFVSDGGLYQSKSPSNLLCVAPDSPIRTAKDLVGRMIAVNGLRNLAQAAVAEWLDKGGVDLKTVGFVELPFPTMGQMVEAGRVDAAFITEPALSQARSRLRILADPFAVLGSQYSVMGFAARAEWVAKNRALAARFRAVIEKTAAWANANPQLSGPILAKYTRVPEPVIATMTRVNYATTLQASSLQPSIDVMAKYGYIPARVDATVLIAQL